MLDAQNTAIGGTKNATKEMFCSIFHFFTTQRLHQRAIRDAQKTGLLNLAGGMGVQTHARTSRTQQGDSHAREQNFF